MKKIISIIILFFIIGKTYGENDLKEEELNIENCYESIYEIGKEKIENIEYIKVETEDNTELLIIQGNFIIPNEISSEIKRNITYKNQYGIREILSNDNNMETYLTFDTLENRELILELDEKAINEKFEFNIEYESNHYLIEFEISIDGENYTKVNKEEILNHDFNFIKIVATCEKFSCIREKIKIFELNIIKKYYEVFFDNINNEDIKIYKDLICEENEGEINFFDKEIYNKIFEEINIEKNDDTKKYVKIEKNKIHKNNNQLIEENIENNNEDEVKKEDNIFEESESENKIEEKIENLESELIEIKELNQIYSDEIESKNRKNNIYMNILIILMISGIGYLIYNYSNKNK